MCIHSRNCHHDCFSSDEADIREEVEESLVMENGYEVKSPSPVIPSSLLEKQVREKKTNVCNNES